MKKRGGRPITGWRRGKQVKTVADVKVGDVLIMDSDAFNATNLVRVKSLRRFPSEADPVDGFYYCYVTPDLTGESSGGSGPTMLIYDYGIEHCYGGFFQAVAEDGNEAGKQYEAEKQALEEHNRRWA